MNGNPSIHCESIGCGKVALMFVEYKRKTEGKVKRIETCTSHHNTAVNNISSYDVYVVVSHGVLP